MQEDKTFEMAIKELEKIVQDLEKGEIDLDKAITKYTEATNLIKYCEEKLDNASATINKIVNNGNIEDFEPEN